MTDPALTLCERLSLHTRDRVGCARPSTRQPYRKCRAPECECGPSAAMIAIREHDRALIEMCASIPYAMMVGYSDEEERTDDEKKQRYWAGANRAASDILAAILKLNEASNDQT